MIVKAESGRHSGKRKKGHMKTTKLLLVASMALAFTFSAWSATSPVKGSARGGATDLLVQPTPATDVAAGVVMACPKCKSEWLVKTDSFARGVNKPSYSAEKHLCGNCSTELKTVGTGKQAKDVAVHFCKGCKS